ncbi:MAG: cation:proton antiporter, partial [Halofilum sp. (in: g-proteobacteria)]
MSEFYLALFVVGAAVVAIALLDRPIERSPLSAPLLMLLLGIALGPFGLDVLNPERWGDPYRILEETARLTLAISIMGIALRLPADFLRRQWRSLALLLGLGMPLMCLASAALSYWLLDVSLLVALLLGAIITPTDPVVASSIVTGGVAQRNLPADTRHTLSAESGANDGLGHPLVMLPLLLLSAPAGHALNDWLLHALAREVGGAVLLGVGLGLAAGHGLRWAERRGNMEQSSFLAYTIALSLLALGVGEVLQVEPLVAVFVTGVAFDQLVGGRDRAQEENVQEAVNQFFTLPVFALLGMMLPWHAWLALGWPALALAIAILLLRRLPILLLLGPGLSALPERKDVAFVGWFGPIGVAALLYAMIALRHTDQPLVWTVTSLIVAASLIVHGVTA